MLAGEDYGMGSSRDWAAKGTHLLGVKAVIAASFERIHRSNLVGMGVLPLQFAEGQTADSLGLDGTETFNIDIPDDLSPRQTIKVTATKTDGRRSSSTPPAASTPPWKWTTTATAASCTRCCATWRRSEKERGRGAKGSRGG